MIVLNVLDISLNIILVLNISFQRLQFYYNISIKNESTNSEVYNEDTNSFTLEDYYYEYSAAFTRVVDSATVSSFDQDTFYILTIKKSGSVIYKDKIFCTNQTISSYTVNENEYTPRETTNDFIVL